MYYLRIISKGTRKVLKYYTFISIGINISIVRCGDSSVGTFKHSRRKLWYILRGPHSIASVIICVDAYPRNTVARVGIVAIASRRSALLMRRRNRSNNPVSFAVAGQRRRLPLQRDFRFTARCRLLDRLLPLTYVSDLVRWLPAFLSFSFSPYFFHRNHRPKPAAIIFVDDRWQSRHHRRIIFWCDVGYGNFSFFRERMDDGKDDIDYFAARKTPSREALSVNSNDTSWQMCSQSFRSTMPVD